MVKENLGLSKSFLLPAAVCPRHSPNICVQNPTITKLIFHHNAIFINAHLFRLMIGIRDISLIFTVAKIECHFFFKSFFFKNKAYLNVQVCCCCPGRPLVSWNTHRHTPCRQWRHGTPWWIPGRWLSSVYGRVPAAKMPTRCRCNVKNHTKWICQYDATLFACMPHYWFLNI